MSEAIGQTSNSDPSDYWRQEELDHARLTVWDAVSRCSLRPEDPGARALATYTYEDLEDEFIQSLYDSSPPGHVAVVAQQRREMGLREELRSVQFTVPSTGDRIRLVRYGTGGIFSLFGQITTPDGRRERVKISGLDGTPYWHDLDPIRERGGLIGWKMGRPYSVSTGRTIADRVSAAIEAWLHEAVVPAAESQAVDPWLDDRMPRP